MKKSKYFIRCIRVLPPFLRGKLDDQRKCLWYGGIVTGVAIILYIFLNVLFLQGSNPFFGFKEKMRESSGIEKTIVKDLLKTKEFLPKITSPDEGGEVSLPVTITGTISEEIDYIELKIDNGTWKKIDSGTNWSIELTGLSLGDHIVYVHSIEGDFSGPDISRSFIVLPDAPTGVNASDGTYTNKVQVTWNPVIEAEKYYVYRSTSSNGTYTELGNVTGTTYDDISAVEGTIYYYKVKAYVSSVGLYSVLSDYDAGIRINTRKMVSVPGGTYIQTDTSANSFSHTISAFKMGKYEVTYELWHAVYTWAVDNGYNFANAGDEGHDGSAGAAPTGAKYEPVTTINWRDTIVWCNAYSEMSGFSPVYKNGSSQVIKDSRDSNGTECDNAVPDWNANGYRLPTEGEWQYAASYKDGASWTPYNYASGATADYNDAVATGLVAWYSANSGSSTHDVGGKAANSLGIYDMSGNVWEWCWDWYDTWPGSAQTDYRGGSGSRRVLRGGSWDRTAYVLLVGNRNDYNPYLEGYSIGFRLVRTP